MKMIVAVAGLVFSASLILVGLVNAQESTSADILAIGENSFTQGQAKAWFEDAGYTNVGYLTLGSDGVWRASARLRGLPALVRLDFQGNVTKH